MEALASIPLIGGLIGGGGAAAAGAGAAEAGALTAEAAGAGMTGAEVGAGALGAGAAGGASSMLPTLMKAAPLVMGAGSLLTKDKTMKDLLGIGSLVAGGANLMGGFGDNTTATPKDAPTTTAGATPAASPVATASGTRFSDLMGAANVASKVGSMVSPPQPSPFKIPTPGQNVPVQGVNPPAAPVAGAPSYTPGGNSPTTNASYQRFMQLMQNQGR